jgi:two-component system, OmpR family, phosphate regulon sensor histidine kinase PhoR
MWREQLGWTATRIVMPWLPGAIFCLYLFERGAIGAHTAMLASAAIFGCVVGIIVLTNRRFAAAAWEATAALGPAGLTAGTPTRRLSPAAQAIRPAVLRLDRGWRETAQAAADRLASAEAVIAAAPDPLILIDGQRRIVRSNAASAEFIGAFGEPRDLAGALRNPLLLAATDAVLQGARARSVEFTMAVPVERVLRARLARLDTPALDGAEAILSLHDVTELKRSDQLRADFVANAGHELKTPLATLIGFIETLLGPARDDAAARERFLGIMNEQARRMARLVDDLLSLSRIELNEHVAPTDRVALEPIVEEVARGLELPAAERDIRVAWDLPADLPEVLGDEDELAQVFQNLVINAIKYGRPHSEVTVTAAASDDATNPQVRVSVADRGEGIAAEHLPRLTERFYRVDNARSRELGGTGLGLAIVKHIVNRHRGRLDIASALGQGSTFTVWLRAAPMPSSNRHQTVTETQ